MDKSAQVIYWDASAILSALVEDDHTDQAQEWLKKRGAHVVSTLSYAEVLAVLPPFKWNDVKFSIGGAKTENN